MGDKRPNVGHDEAVLNSLKRGGKQAVYGLLLTVVNVSVTGSTHTSFLLKIRSINFPSRFCSIGWGTTLYAYLERDQ